MSERFFSTLNYTSVNEDWRTEACGLKMEETDSVLCITGSGARPLDLLWYNPASITAIDKNPAQNHLLSLKMAAMQKFTYQDYIAFLGLHEARPSWRYEKLRKLLPDLHPECRSFWEKHHRYIRAGILYQGRWERNYRRVAKLAQLLRPRKIPRLFSFEDIDNQRAFVQQSWDTGFWKLVNTVVCSPISSRLFFRDPAFYKYVQVQVAKVLYERMLSSLMHYPANKNFMMSLVLRGRLAEHDLPPHLTPEGFEYIRSQLSKINILTSDIITHLQRSQRQIYTRFSLSDLPSYLTGSGFNHLLNGVTETSAPYARIVVRQFLTRYDVPETFKDVILREPDLEMQMRVQDRAFAYNFIVGEINHG